MLLESTVEPLRGQRLAERAAQAPQPHAWLREQSLDFRFRAFTLKKKKRIILSHHLFISTYPAFFFLCSTYHCLTANSGSTSCLLSLPAPWN